MNEIKQRAERAQYWRQFLDRDDKIHWQWCVFVGLWETSILANRNNGYRNRMFKWSE